MKKHLNPKTLVRPQGNSYCQLVTTEANTFIYISGQVAHDAAGQLVAPGDILGQTRQALENIRLALAAAGAAPSDIVMLTYYVVDYKPEYGPQIINAAEAFFGDVPAPAGTLIGITALMLPELMIEIQAVAAI